MRPPDSTPASELSVGQVLGSFGGGGAQRLAFNLSIGLGQRGARSLAIALRQAGHYAEVPPPRVKLVSLEAADGGPWGLVRAALRLRRLVRQERLDVLHVHGTASLPFVALATLGLRRRLALAFTWQDSERVLTETGWRRRRMVWALRQCASVSGSSRSVADRLIAGAGLRDVGIFHGGVPIEPPYPERIDSSPALIWIGRMIPNKDPQALVRAAAVLRDEGHSFSVDLVGKALPSTEWYLDQTRALAEELRLTARVRIPGFVPDAEMPKLYTTAQIGVQTSHTEGLSIALMEQMMAGLAIVATDVGDTSSAIQHERNGLLVPPRDEEALVSALRRLIRDPVLRRRLGESARESAIREFSVDAMADRALAQYARVTGRRQDSR